MPFEQHPSFPQPADPHLKLWRYMDFIKLLSLVQRRTLYFPSAYQLLEQDPFEGSFTAYHAKHQLGGTVGGEEPHTSWVTERNVPPPDWSRPAEDWHFLQRVGREERQSIRKYMCINSWHMNEYESVAMWKLYDQSGNGIAIVSNLGRLQKSLEKNNEKIHIGQVQYIDYKNEERWLGNYFAGF